MEKRSRRHIRDLVALAASQGLSQNEIGCARISMMARSTNAPFKGRIQKRKTNRLQIIKSSLQRTAGPYKVPTAEVARRLLLRHSGLAQPALEPPVKFHTRGVVVGHIVPLLDRPGAGAFQREVLGQRRACFRIAAGQGKFGG